MIGNEYGVTWEVRLKDLHDGKLTWTSMSRVYERLESAELHRDTLLGLPNNVRNVSKVKVRSVSVTTSEWEELEDE